MTCPACGALTIETVAADGRWTWACLECKAAGTDSATPGGPMPKAAKAEQPQPLPFPFDVKQALVAIISQNAETERARALYERKKADAKDAKDKLDALEAGLGELIGEYEQRMIGAVPPAAIEEPEPE
jgi:hypothetical protein